MTRFTKFHDGLHILKQDGVAVEVRELGLSEGFDKELWHIIVDGHNVDAAERLRDAKRLARVCLANALAQRQAGLGKPLTDIL
jgi:hypothetical protein